MEYFNKFFKFIFNGDNSLVEGIIHVKKYDSKTGLVSGPAFYVVNDFSKDYPRFSLIDTYIFDLKKLNEECSKEEADEILMRHVDSFKEKYLD